MRALKVRISIVTYPNGKTATRETVRCPGNCGTWTGIERRDDGTVRIVGHGGGPLGFHACTASGRVILVK